LRLRKGSVTEPPTTFTVSNSGVWIHHSSLASVTRTAIRWPAAIFQSADHRSIVFAPLERARKPGG
jgi:hypothetical protein